MLAELTPLFVLLVPMGKSDLSGGHLRLAEAVFLQGTFQTMSVTYAADVMPVHLRQYLTTYVNLCWVLGQIVASGVLRAMVGNTTQWAYRVCLQGCSCCEDFRLTSRHLDSLCSAVHLADPYLYRYVVDVLSDLPRPLIAKCFRDPLCTFQVSSSLPSLRIGWSKRAGTRMRKRL